jgi:hypothetical protein
MTKKFDTHTPHLSDATLARIRAAAHQFVLAGGTIFPNHSADDDVHEHIGKVARAIDLKRAARDEAWADTLEGLDHTTHERIWTAAVGAMSNTSEAGFLFGAFVGLELAALTFGHLATIPTAPAARLRKGPRR